MKEILAFVRRPRVSATRDELRRIGCPGYFVTAVVGRGRQRGIRSQDPRGTAMGFLPRVLFTIVVEDDQVEETTEAIIRANQTGYFGDGRIFVVDVGEAYRISTSDRPVMEAVG